MRVMRERAGLTQEQLAELVGCRQPAISAWENGTRVPAARRGRVAGAIGVDPARLEQPWDEFLLDGGGAAL